MKMMRTAIVLVLFLSLSSLVSGQRNGTSSWEACSQNAACYPWSLESGGPACLRGNKISMRFALDVAEEDKTLAWDKLVCGINTGPNTPHYVTYAFCPKVDTLQAFTLNVSGLLSATWVRPDGATVTSAGEAWLRAYGMGTKGDREFPQRRESSGAVQVVGACEDPLLSSSVGTEGAATAVVPFLILNVSMERGMFKYYEDFPQAAGVGFVPTCEVTKGVDVCTLDAEMSCLGPPGQKNCAFCYTNDRVEEIKKINMQVWTSYYGTDRVGRNFRSGSNNPLNFRAYSGGGLYTSMADSFDKVKSGNFNDDPEDIPDGGVGAL